MSNFANALFSVLFGWLRTAVQWLWNNAIQSGEGGMLAWIGSHWLGLTLALCALGMLLDWIVYLIRWQPYKVWASFFRRVTGKDRLAQEDVGSSERPWPDADGAVAYDEAASSADAPLPEEAVYPGVYAYTPPAPAAYTPPALETQRAETAGRMNEEAEAQRPESRSRRVLRRRYIPDEDEMPLRYAPPPAAEIEASYRKPYYPPQWRQDAQTKMKMDMEGKRP